MNKRFAHQLDFIFEAGVLILAFVTPLLFWEYTTDFYETPKFLLLTLVEGVFLLAWTTKYLTSGRGKLSRTPLDLPLYLLLVVFAISTFFAASKSVAIFGLLPRIHGGLVSFVLYIALYFILVSNLKGAKIVKRLVYFLTASGVILSVVSLLSYFGKVILPFPWASTVNFTPTGSSFSTAAILAMLLPFPLIAILQGSDDKQFDSAHSNLKKLLSQSGLNRQTINRIILSLILILFVSTIALIGSFATYIATAAVFLLIFITSSPSKMKKNLPFTILPLLVGVFLLVFSFFSIGGAKNSLYNRAQSFPQELHLPLQTSWKISISAFRDFPLWGSGPASYLTNFTIYKPVEFNSFKFWTIRFDQAFNEYLQTLATLGSLGLIALLLLTTIFVSFAIKTLTSPKGDLNTSLAISGIVFFIVLAFHSSTLSLWVVGIIVLSAFVILQKNYEASTETTETLPRSNNSLNLNFDTLPIVFLVIVAIAVSGLFYFTSRYTLADYYHRQALNSVNQGKLVDAYTHLLKSEQLNPNIDLYRVDIAQTNFALADALASAKISASKRGESNEASTSASLTDKDKQDIQTFLSQAIAEGKVATTLNPKSAANWEVLGSIYQQVSGVAQNALAFSLDSYGQAIKYDPANPALRLTVGGIYYSIKNYDLAIRFFTDAVNLKPDYANGYYNLALAMKEKGDKAGSQSMLEKTMSLLETNRPDYKKAADLLASLKEQQSTPSASQTTETPPSALQNKNLPKLALPTPGKISTPPAVKKPTPTP